MGEERMIGTLVVAVMAAMALVLAAGALIVGGTGMGGPGARPPRIGDGAVASDVPTVLGVELTEFAIAPATSPSPRAAR
jgi:hypothetical protein